MRSPRWPLWLWCLQFFPIALLLAIAGWRYRLGNTIPADPSKTWVLFGFAGAWALAALGMLVFPVGRRWLIRRRKEWCASAVSLLIAFILLDSALTVFGIVPTIEQQRSRSIAYSAGRHTKSRLVPKDIVLYDGTLVHINRRGLRGKEFAARKTPGQFRILVLGGSQVLDYSGGGWPAMVEANLRTLGYNVEVLNAGVPGHNTVDSLGKTLTDLWTLKPDIIFLCQAWNDIKYFSWLDPDHPFRGLPPLNPQPWLPDWRIYPRGFDRIMSNSAIYRQFRWGISQLLYNEEGRRRQKSEQSRSNITEIKSWGLEQYRLDLVQLESLSQEIGAELILCKQAHLAVEGGKGPEQEAAQDYGLRMTGLPHLALMHAFDSTYQIVDDVAHRWGLRIADMDKALSGKSDDFRDGIHFSPKGSRAAAKLAAQTIVKALSEDNLQPRL